MRGTVAGNGVCGNKKIKNNIYDGSYTMGNIVQEGNGVEGCVVLCCVVLCGVVMCCVVRVLCGVVLELVP